MFSESTDTPRGYVYPQPSIEGGQTSNEPKTSPKILSRENADKIRDAVRRIEERAGGAPVGGHRSR